MRNNGLLSLRRLSAVCLTFSGLILATRCLATGPPPVIVAQPADLTVPIQGTATFSVTADSQTTLTYQWLKNNGKIGGAKSSSYTINNVKSSDAATYSVEVSNSGGTVTSSDATLTVLVPPTIQQQPGNQTVTPGQTASFSVSANGTAPLSYQWNFNGDALTGQTNDALSVTDVQGTNAGSYTVVVSSPAGTVTSQRATLTVALPPTITVQPTDMGVLLGQSATFSVTATGTGPLSYQWYFGILPVLLGGNSSTLTVANILVTSLGSYYVVVKNNWGSATSVTVTLGMATAVAITTPPQNQQVLQGQDVAFSVACSGSGPLGYQWNFNGAPIDGSTGSSLIMTNVQTSQAGSYSVTVNNVLGPITSTAAALTVNVPAGIVSQTPNQAVVQGQSVTFSVSPGGTAPFGYQWNFNGTPLAAANDGTLTLTDVQSSQAGSYTVLVSNLWGSVTSTVATLTVNVPASIANQPQSQSAATGQPVNFYVTASGTGLFSYQWNLNGAPLSGATNSMLTLTPACPTNAGGYTVLVSNPWGSATSLVATLTVTNPIVNLSVPTGGGMTTNGFAFQFPVPIGATYVILASTDLQVWTPVATNVALTGINLFTDASATNYTGRYYQVVIQ